MDADNQNLKVQLLILVKRGLKRMQVVNILGFFAGLIVGPGFIALGFALQKGFANAGPGFDILALFVGGTCSIILAVLIVQMFQRSVIDKRLLEEIIEKRETLLWVYIEYRQGQTSGVPFKGTVSTGAYYHVYFLFSDKKQTKAWLKQEDAYALFKLIGTLFPQISLGWHPDRYKQWKKDPSSIESSPYRVGDMKPYVFRNRV